MLTKNERLTRLSVRVSPKALKKLSRLQDSTGESLSSVLREVIDEGLKAKTKDLNTKD